MATRGAIGIAHGERVKAIYVHYDNYPEYTGFILENFYKDSVIVNKLISMGDGSQLGTEIGEKHDFRAETGYIEVNGREVAKECTFYNRDRDEAVSWLSHENVQEFTKHYKSCGAEYFYLYRNDKWYVKSYRGQWQLLSKVLRKGNT